jgi:hypothetical protein
MPDTKMIQLTIYRNADETIETNKGIRKWDNYLITERKRFLRHGRIAIIKSQGKYQALYVDDVAKV